MKAEVVVVETWEVVAEIEEVAVDIEAAVVEIVVAEKVVAAEIADVAVVVDRTCHWVRLEFDHQTLK